MDVLFWSELLVVQVSISIERPASTQKVRPMIGRPADVQIWSFNGSSKIGTRWTTAGYIKIGTPVKGKKLDVHGMSVTYNKQINRKWTIGYPMDVLWIMCASRDITLQNKNVFGQTVCWQINFEIWNTEKMLPWHPPRLTRSLMLETG
jgi:hypothetical protein